MASHSELLRRAPPLVPIQPLMGLGVPGADHWNRQARVFVFKWNGGYGGLTCLTDPRQVSPPAKVNPIIPYL